MKIGVLKETKNPPDKRVPLSPLQCKEVLELFPNVELVVQKSEIRKYKDEEYSSLGINMSDDLSDCDILLGVKEVALDAFIPNKTYLFFSHTYKFQPYNAKLLKKIIDLKIRLVDYEMIKEPTGRRLIGFGRYAGVVGCYNGFRALGIKHDLYDLKPAYLCEDREEMEEEMNKIVLPKNTKVVLTGWGRVGHGAREIMDLVPIKEVEPQSFLNDQFDEPVFTHLETDEYNQRITDKGYDRSEFYSDPSGYESKFPKYAKSADMYVACHYWKEGSPFIFTREDMKAEDWTLKVVADVSCDIDGPVACTLRPSTIIDPLYGYNRFTEKETDYMDSDAICVMAVDNLPCELPKDASEDFGNELIQNVLPHLLGDDAQKIIANASETTLDGKLSEKFAYLQDYVDQA